MFILIARLIVIIAGPVIGYFKISPGPQGILIGTAVACGVIFVEILIQKIPLDDIVAGILGLVLGLISAKLLDYSIALTESPRLLTLIQQYSLLIKIVFAYIGMVIALKKKEEIDLLDKNILSPSRTRLYNEIKILDTSALIDGRISEIGQTGFIEGTVAIPSFVLKELQSLADSHDQLKRARGVRGLDILKQLQQDRELQLKVVEKDYPEEEEVDAKIVKMAEELKAKIVTTDYNLNKLASVKGIKVLNVNELSNAVKAMVLPGEALQVFVLKEGKERGQGVGYLDDGTMVVVEEGKKFIGRKIEVVVENIHQTSAGRIVFAQPHK